jgi:ligand-binding sensor domain-containing protein
VSSPKRIRYAQPPSRRPVRHGACFLALLVAIFLVDVPRALAALPNEVLQATIDAQIVRYPMSDGHGINFSRLSRSAGLSQTRVSQIAQDNQGFVWFGTQHGLARYDGYRLREFKHDPTDPDTLSGVDVFDLFKDRSGALWVACYDSLDRLDPTTERVTHFRIDSADSHGQSQRVIHISQDSDGMLWLATDNGLYRFDPHSGHSVRFGHNPADPSSLSSNSIKSTTEDRAGMLWVATGEGMDSFDRVAGKVLLHIPLKESREMTFFQDSRGRDWITFASGRNYWRRAKQGSGPRCA